MKKIFILFLLSIIFISPFKTFAQDTSIDPIYAKKNISTPIIYQEPEWGTTSIPLTEREIVSTFSYVIYSRNKMISNITNYRKAGYTGPAVQYLTALDRFAAPNNNYSSLTGQTTLCTETDFYPTSDNIDMDPGDFCEIQNAIVTNTCLLEYPDICPTEDFFLHKSENGYRYSKPSGEYYSYKPNPSNADYIKYVIYRAQREIFGGKEVDYNGTIRSHSASGANGIFLDNLELSWEKVIREGGQPMEYTSSTEYANAVANLVNSVHDSFALTEKNIPIWANLISDPNIGFEWDRFITDNSLEGAMMENFVLDWGDGYQDNQDIIKQINTAERWTNSGRLFLGVSQGNLDLGERQFYTQGRFAIGAFLLGVNYNSGFFYDNYAQENGYNTTHYNQYFNFKEYYYRLGNPFGSKQLVSQNPLVYKRYFNCGVVTVDFTNKSSYIKISNICLLTTNEYEN